MAKWQVEGDYRGEREELFFSRKKNCCLFGNDVSFAFSIKIS